MIGFWQSEPDSHLFAVISANAGTINWGDGSADEPIDPDAAHAYPAVGVTYTVTVTPDGVAPKAFPITTSTSAESPHIATISPGIVNIGSPDTVVTMTGTGFVGSSVWVYAPNGMMGTLSWDSVDASGGQFTAPGQLFSTAGNIVFFLRLPSGVQSNTKTMMMNG